MYKGVRGFHHKENKLHGDYVVLSRRLWVIESLASTYIYLFLASTLVLGSKIKNLNTAYTHKIYVQRSTGVSSQGECIA